MPIFKTDDVYEDDDKVSIEPSDFVDSCSNLEVMQLIAYLTECGYLYSPRLTQFDRTIIEDELIESLDNIFDNRLRMSLEDEQTIHNISKKL